MGQESEVTAKGTGFLGSKIDPRSFVHVKKNLIPLSL